MPLSYVVVEVGRDISERVELDLGRFRRLVVEFVEHAYPRAQVIVVFNDLLSNGRIDVGARGNAQHEQAVRQMIARASERSRKRLASAGG
jgi:hypothetical protein